MVGCSAWMWNPTVSEPVNEMTGSRSSATRRAVASLPRGSTDHIPEGRSVSARISPSSSAVRGVAGAGLMMTGAPTARAGATLWATRFSGKLKGAIPRIGPCGNRRIIAMRPAAAASVSSRCNSPDHRRASSAAHRNLETPLFASARDHINGLPFSAVIRWATSSARAANCCETCIRASARWAAVVAIASAWTSYAAATAASTSAVVGTQMLPTTAPSNGLWTSMTSSLVRDCPAIQNGRAVTGWPRRGSRRTGCPYLR